MININLFKYWLGGLFLLFHAAQVFCFSVSHEDAVRIAQKIWHNECGGKQINLTCWNKGENFASLGIGHFIWYPPNEKVIFKQTFPSFLQFLVENGVDTPKWLMHTSGCPWSDRESFYWEIESPRMQELRQFLFETREWQALFMAQRLEKAVPMMVQKLPIEEKEHVTELFKRLEKDSRGLYALLDYFNFKGEGTVTSETYNGQGWGLLQVLLAMPSAKTEGECDIVSDFVQSAREILKRRVENAPPEKHEERWLKGWLNRVDSYRGG